MEKSAEFFTVEMPPETERTKGFDEDGVMRHFASGKRDIKVLKSLEGEVDVPISDYGYLTSPIEISTGIPLPLLTSKVEEVYDRHHSFFYLNHYKQEEAYKSVRSSRLQLVPRSIHNAYHRYFDGTLYPQDAEAAFRITILNGAGYIPDYGVDMDETDIIVRPISEEERQILRHPNAFVAERNREGKVHPGIGQFLINYSVGQNFNDLKQQEVEQFLEISEEDVLANPALMQKKYKLGMAIAELAIGRSAEHLYDDFRKERKSPHFKHSGLGRVSPLKIAKLHLLGREDIHMRVLDETLRSMVEAA